MEQWFLQNQSGVKTMTKSEKILLPNGKYVDRLYENALIMEIGYQNRFDEMFFGSDTKAGAILMYIMQKMDENNEFVSNLDNIAKALRYSRATVSRVVKLFKEKYSDLVTVSKQGVVSKFTIDKNRCFKA